LSIQQSVQNGHPFSSIIADGHGLAIFVPLDVLLWLGAIQMHKLILLSLLAALSLGGCAGSPFANERAARDSYEKATADYRACLSATTDPKTCEAKRTLMAAEEHHFQVLSNDLQRGVNPNRSVSVTSIGQ
jgi:hypothetical protein